MAKTQGRRSQVRIDYSTLVEATQTGKETPPIRLARQKLIAQVYRVVAAVLGPRSHDVKDVTHEAFMRVYKAIHTFSYDPANPGGPTAWVNRIALHAALDHRSSLRPWVPVDEGALQSTSDDEVEEMVGALDRSTLAAALLDLLDEQHRAILLLYYWSDETQEEIARTLKIPLGTVKTRMRAAYQIMKEYVLKHADELMGDGGGRDGGPHRA